MMNGLSKSSSVQCERAAHTMSRYEIPASDTDLASIFETIECKQEELEIVDFSVSQTTLEDGASLGTRRHCMRMSKPQPRPFELIP